VSSRSPPRYDPAALGYPNLRIPIQNLLQPACNLDDASDLDVWNSPWQMQIGGIVALMLIVRMGFEYSYVFTTSQQWCHELAKVNTNSWNHNFEVDVCWVVLNCSIVTSSVRCNVTTLSPTSGELLLLCRRFSTLHYFVMGV
jgi:hypothetical protein